MKLLYIANQRLPTEKAYGVQIAKMCEAFANEGLNVTLLFPTRDTPIKETLFKYYDVAENFKIHKIKSLDFDWPGKIAKLSFHIKMSLSAILLVWRALLSKADVIYSRDELPILILSLFRRGLYFEAHKISSSKRWVYKTFMSKGIKIITTTGIMRDEFISLGFDPNNLIIEHDGVDLSHFTIADDRAELRKKFGLAENKTIVGYVGHLTTMGVEKGLDDLFKAMKVLQKDNPDIQLVVVGGTEGDIKEHQKRTGGIDVIFTGHKNHDLIPGYLKSFDILVMPFPQTHHYAHYMSPLKMFEYMASGKPIVATKLPSIEEVLNNENSVLVAPNSPEALAGGIKKIVDDIKFGHKISKRALQDAQNYTWQKRAERIIEFIKIK